MAHLENSQIQTEELPTIDLQALLGQEPQETERQLLAAKQHGFFYLDLGGITDIHLSLKTLEDIYAFEEKLFNLPQEELLKYDVDEIGFMKLNGYKPRGRNVAGLKSGRDGFESYAIPKDGVLNLGDEAFPRPAIFDEHMTLLSNAMRAIQGALLAIHQSLSRALQLREGERLEDFHRLHETSPCLLRLLRYHAQPEEERGAPQTPHTDLGSLTMLFTKQPDLQVLARGTADWKYVDPKPGCAIVNIGDGLSMMTNGLLQSSLHRVAPPPDQAMAERYSFAFLQRAEENTPLTGLRSPLIPHSDGVPQLVTSGEWLNQKFAMLRARTHDVQKQWVLTGRDN